MQVVVKHGKSKISLLVKNVEIDSMINLLFPDEIASYDAFDKIKALGIKCYHAGKNAPSGPAVSVCNTKEFNIKIQ